MGNDGLGQPWIPGLFDPLDMSLPSQSAIMFSPQVAPQDGAPTHNSKEEEELQNEILLSGLDDLDDDPQDIHLFQMDEAMSNIGAVSNMFDQDEKGIMKDLWRKWHITSWESLSEELV